MQLGVFLFQNVHRIIRYSPHLRHFRGKPFRTRSSLFLNIVLENTYEYDLYGVRWMGSICSMQIRRNHFKNSKTLARLPDKKFDSEKNAPRNFANFRRIFIQNDWKVHFHLRGKNVYLFSIVLVCPWIFKLFVKWQF